jgi:hypothetical protein
MSDSVNTTDSVKAWAAVVVAAIAFLVYIVLGVLAWTKADSAGAEAWARLLIVFAGFESIAFAAVGWLFGKEVSRQAIEQSDKALAIGNQALEDAKAVAKESQSDAQAARSVAGEAQREAVALAQSLKVLSQTDRLEAVGRADVDLAQRVLEKYGLGAR